MFAAVGCAILSALFLSLSPHSHYWLASTQSFTMQVVIVIVGC